jgi:hypothetical protein
MHLKSSAKLFVLELQQAITLFVMDCTKLKNHHCIADLAMMRTMTINLLHLLPPVDAVMDIPVMLISE